MTWKHFTIAFVSAVAAISFPQNIIGCGGGDEYYGNISFFNKYVPQQMVYQPFYYTQRPYLYNEEEQAPASKVIAKEWAAMTTNNTTATDAYDFVMQYALPDVTNLYYHIEKNNALKIPDSVKKNSMTQYFLKDKNLEALGYIMFAKKIEPFTNQDQWSNTPAGFDSLQVVRLMKNGVQLWKAAKTDAFRLKYGYQVARLALYNRQYKETLHYYDSLIAPTTTNSILQHLSTSLKAGALYRLGKRKEAAYIFSQMFEASDVKKVSNYVSFHWAISESESIDEYLQLCKTNKEKAAMLSLFQLGNDGIDVATLKKIYQLNPGANALPTLVTREINKLEISYLTPHNALEKDEGRSRYAVPYNIKDHYEDSIMRQEEKSLRELLTFTTTAAKKGDTKNTALMQLSAAYSAFMLGDYKLANEHLATTKTMPLNDALNDQWMLTNLLVNVQESTPITAAVEVKILPSVKWLLKKGTRKEDAPYDDRTSIWEGFAVNFMKDILAKKYYEQGDAQKEVLALGVMDSINIWGATGVETMRNRMNGPALESFYTYLNNKQFTPFEKLLVDYSKATINDVVDFGGTAHLRDHNFDKAIDWFSRNGNDNKVVQDPFIELLYDQIQPLPSDKHPGMSKLQYAKEMKALQQKVNADKKNAGQHLYKMGLGFYNSTYYGYAWDLVEYYRSGVDGYYFPEKGTAFEKDYYGAVTAHDYFKKAMEASNDPELKAKCLFMMARCSQKQVDIPSYYNPNYTYTDYDQYKMDREKGIAVFMNNKYFPEFIEKYKSTKFYTEAYNSCSYLRDFLKK